MRKIQMPRDFYFPKHATPLDCTGTDAAVYVYEEANKFFAVGFHGKALKPDFHYRYSSAQSREQSIASYLEGRKSRAEMMDKRKVERSAPHTLKAGDILKSSWGYDQPNVYFYEVTRVVGENSVEIRSIGYKCVDSNGFQDHVLPVRGTYYGDPMLKRASAGNFIRLTSYSTASPWSGSAMYRTSSGAGH